MKKLIICLALLVGISGHAQTTPIYGGQLQTDLDAGGHTITNLSSEFAAEIGAAPTSIVARVDDIEMWPTQEWTTAHGWGDHSTAGYADTATVAGVDERVTDIEMWPTQSWTTAYGWGDHNARVAAIENWPTQQWSSALLAEANLISRKEYRLAPGYNPLVGWDLAGFDFLSGGWTNGTKGATPASADQITIFGNGHYTHYWLDNDRVWRDESNNEIAIALEEPFTVGSFGFYLNRSENIITNTMPSSTEVGTMPPGLDWAVAYLNYEVYQRLLPNVFGAAVDNRVALVSSIRTAYDFAPGNQIWHWDPAGAVLTNEFGWSTVATNDLGGIKMDVGEWLQSPILTNGFYTWQASLLETGPVRFVDFELSEDGSAWLDPSYLSDGRPVFLRLSYPNIAPPPGDMDTFNITTNLVVYDYWNPDLVIRTNDFRGIEVRVRDSDYAEAPVRRDRDLSEKAALWHSQTNDFNPRIVGVNLATNALAFGPRWVAQEQGENLVFSYAGSPVFEMWDGGTMQVAVATFSMADTNINMSVYTTAQMEPSPEWSTNIVDGIWHALPTNEYTTTWPTIIQGTATLGFGALDLGTMVYYRVIASGDPSISTKVLSRVPFEAPVFQFPQGDWTYSDGTNIFHVDVEGTTNPVGRVLSEVDPTVVAQAAAMTKTNFPSIAFGISAEQAGQVATNVMSEIKWHSVPLRALSALSQQWNSDRYVQRDAGNVPGHYTHPYILLPATDTTWVKCAIPSTDATQIFWRATFYAERDDTATATNQYHFRRSVINPSHTYTSYQLTTTNVTGQPVGSKYDFQLEGTFGGPFTNLSEHIVFYRAPSTGTGSVQILKWEFGY